MRPRDLERELAQAFISGLAIYIIFTLIGLYVMYLIIRWGVRDGMRDAQRGSRDQREPVRHRPAAARADLPDLRVD